MLLCLLLLEQERAFPLSHQLVAFELDLLLVLLEALFELQFALQRLQSFLLLPNL
jgi:hypothetical protein